MSQITMTQLRNALYDLLKAEQTASPALLRQVLRYRPGALTGEKPCAWVGDLFDDLGYDAGTRARTITGEVVIATSYPADLVTDNDPLDNLRDALLERFTSAVQVIPTTILELTRMADGDVSFPGVGEGVTVTARGLTLSIQLRIWEGRI